MTRPQEHRGLRTADDDGTPLGLFALPEVDASPPHRRIIRPAARARTRPVSPLLPLPWPCPGCGAEVDAEGRLCEGCVQRRCEGAYSAWLIELALLLELGARAREGMWYESEAPDRLEEVVARAAAAADPDRSLPFDYGAWCRRYWEAWGLVDEREATGRCVETWFFDQPMEDFDPECDVEFHLYPRPARHP